MNKCFFIFVCFFMSFLSNGRAQTESLVANNHSSEDFQTHMIRWITQCVQQDAMIPKKDELLSLIREIGAKHVVVQQGNDELRVKFVNAQGCIEHVLACMQALGDIHHLIGVIHTPTPSTPLCTKPDPIDVMVLDESIRNNPAKLWTVRSRAHIVRDFLSKGGTLYVVYPKGGLEKRTAQQQAIYKEELAHFKSNLIDFVLPAETMDDEMIGASYFFQNQHNQTFFFSIKARQANDPTELSEWGLWLGSVEDPQIAARIQAVLGYFEKVQGPKKSLLMP
jgi:hypothetical protein